MRILLVPNYKTKEELEKEGINVTASVEAEYGDKVILGEVATLAHHTEEYKNNPAPCNTENVPVLDENSTIVISHIDLDTLGGISALMGRKIDDKEFWKAAEFIDLNGPHNLYRVNPEVRQRYVAYQAYQTANRAPRITEITDVTESVMEKLDVVDKAIKGDKELVETGKKWDEEVKSKIEACLVYENENVRIFNSPEGVFCSASYYSEKQGKVIPATVTLNGRFKAVTMALENGGKEISAKEMVQSIWGPEAGGHKGIAGSPRGQEMTEADLEKLAKVLNEKINEVRGTSVKFEYNKSRNI